MVLGIEETLFVFAPEDIGAQTEVQDLRLLLKASFGGDRSAAGRYAAEQRWKGHVKREDKPSERGSLDDEVTRVSNELRDIANLPVREFGQNGTNLTITPEEWESYDKAQFVWVAQKGGKQVLVVTKRVMEAEKAVRAVGGRALQQVHEELVASGKLTQQELDDAKAFMSRQDAPPDNRSSVEKLVERAKAGDTSLPARLLEEAQGVIKAEARAKETKSALIKATRAYTKFLDEGEQMRLSGRNQTAEEIAEGQVTERRLWQERRAAKFAHADAKSDLRLAERNLEVWATDETDVMTAQEQFKDNDRLKQNAIRVQGIVGEGVMALLSSRRAMPSSVPMRDVSTPDQMTIMRDGKSVAPYELAREVLAETRRRLPEAVMRLLERTGLGGVAIRFTSRGGGQYDSTRHEIRSDLDDADTISHEMVHGISYNSRETRLLEQAALQRRVFGKVDEPDAPFSEKLKVGLQKVVGATKAMGFRFSGKYVEDKFTHKYQGRLYDYARQGGGRVPKLLAMDGATEILTVSTENVFGGGQFFKKNGKLDAELMELSLGWLLSAEGGK